jgi:hypothetical protein
VQPPRPYSQGVHLRLNILYNNSDRNSDDIVCDMPHTGDQAGWPYVFIVVFSHEVTHDRDDLTQGTCSVSVQAGFLFLSSWNHLVS